MESWLNHGWRVTAGVIGLSAPWLGLRADEPATSRPEDDPYQWLEEVTGAKPLEWVRAHNEATAKRLQARPEYAGLYRDALAALDSASRIPDVEQRGNLLYNLWRDP